MSDVNQSQMNIVISRVHDNLFTGPAESVTVPSIDGELTILSIHEPLVVPLARGTITLRTAEETHTFPCEGGVVEVSNNQVTILL